MRKQSLAKGVFLTKFSLARVSDGKLELHTPVKIFLDDPWLTLSDPISTSEISVITWSSWWFVTFTALGQYCQTCNISCTFVGNKIVDHSDVVGASPVGTAPTTSSFLT